MNFKKLLFLILIATNSLIAQEFIGRPIESSAKQLLDMKFKAYQLMKLDVSAIQNSLNSRSTAHQLTITSDNLDWKLSLSEFDMFKKDFYVSIAGDHGIIKKNDRAGIRTYKVLSNSKRTGLSCLTIADHFIYGYIEDAGVKTHIEPLRYFDENASADDFIVYKETDVNKVDGITCGMDDFHSHINEAKGQENSNRSACISVDVAIACDKTIFDNKGGVGNSEAFVTGVLNDVQTNYDNEFTTAIEFNISTIFVATTTGTDPWNGVNNINTHLDIHRSWANGGGYGGASYAVASAWTRKYTSGAIGLAWVGALCGSYRYNVCSDFGGSAGLLRCLQAHELGHNFNAVHDASGSGFIMAPAVSNSTTWSPASQTNINAYVKTVGCVGVCGSGAPPIADFVGTPTIVCPNGTVKFTDLSQNLPNKWVWTFPGGTPSTSTQQNPTVQYKVTGTYDVTLMVTSTFGSNTITQKAYIEVLPLVSNSFTTFTIDRDLSTFNDCINADTYLWKFGDNTTSTDFEPTHTYAKDGIFTVELCATNTCGTVCKSTKVVIVTPVDAAFASDVQDGCTSLKVKYKNLSSSNSTAFLWSFPGGVPSVSTEKEPTITYPNKGIYDVKLTASNSKYTSTKFEKGWIRADSKPESDFDSKAPIGKSIEFINLTIDSIAPWKYTYNWLFGDGNSSKERNPTHVYANTGKFNVCLITNNTCGVDTTCKEVEISAVLTSVFSVTKNKGCVPFSVDFKNNSTGANKYFWNFPGGIPSTSTDPNPKVVYNQKGSYDVSMIAYNGNDSAISKQNGYINVNALPTTSFNFSVSKLKVQFNNKSVNGTTYSWNFGDNGTSTETNPEHEYKLEGEYDVELTATNECGDTKLKSKIAIYLIPKVNFNSNHTNICVGDYISLGDLSSIDVIDWKWQIDGASPPTSIEKNPRISFLKTGVYSIKLTVKNSNGENSLTKTSYITVKSPVLCPKHKGRTKNTDANNEEFNDLEERSSNTFSSLVISPNPANDVLQVSLPENFHSNICSIVLTDVNGKEHKIQSLNRISKNELSIDLANMTTGVYMIFIRENDQIINQKIVIVR